MNIKTILTNYWKSIKSYLVTNYQPKGSYSDSGHNHDNRYYTETEIDTKLSGKSDSGHNHDNRYYTETEIDTKLSGKSDTSHTHDDRYYTESEVNNLLGGKSDTSHNHNSAYLGISAKAESAKSADSVAWGNVTGKPSTFAPSSHTHDNRYYTETEVNNLLSGKANSSHTHDDRYYTESEVNNLLSEYVKQTDMINFNTGSCFIGFYSSVSSIDGVGSGGALTVGANTSAANVYDIVAVGNNSVTLSKNITLVGTWKLISAVSGRTSGGYGVTSISVTATNGPGSSYQSGVLATQGLFVRVA